MVVLALLILTATPELPARGVEPAAPGGLSSPDPAARSKPKRGAKPLPRPAEIGAKWGVVTSLLRSREHNRAVGGAPNSYHLHGRAIDIARRRGVAHAEIEAAYRKAGYRLIESLDEGDHSHFAFGIGGAPSEPAAQLAAAIAAPANACAALPPPQARRRPDRWDGCADPAEPKPRLRPIEQPTP